MWILETSSYIIYQMAASAHVNHDNVMKYLQKWPLWKLLHSTPFTTYLIKMAIAKQL